MSVAQPIFKPEDKGCEKLFRDTCTRALQGGFVVRFPLKSKPSLLAAETRSMALKLLKHTHTRFSGNSSLAKAYKDFMNTYMILDHMA